MRFTPAARSILGRKAGAVAGVAIGLLGTGVLASPASALEGVRVCYTEQTSVNRNVILTMWTQPKGKSDCKSKEGHPEVTTRSVSTALVRYGSSRAVSEWTTDKPITCEDFGARYSGRILEQTPAHDVCRYLAQGREKQLTVTWVKLGGSRTPYRVVNWAAIQQRWKNNDLRVKSCHAWNARAMRDMRASNGADYYYKDFKVAGLFGAGIDSSWSAGAKCSL